MTSSILGRLGSHARNPVVRQRLRYVLVEQVASREEAADLERELIRRFRPPFNVIYNPGGKPLQSMVRLGTSSRPGVRVPDLGYEDEPDGFEFRPMFCPLCGHHHHPAEPHPATGEEE